MHRVGAWSVGKVHSMCGCSTYTRAGVCSNASPIGTILPAQRALRSQRVPVKAVHTTAMASSPSENWQAFATLQSNSVLGRTFGQAVAIVHSS